MAPPNHGSLPQIGDIVPFHFSPGLMVASYFVSLSGAITTVELLHRRKTGRGWRSWAQLGACSVSFGLVAIWCMHFVGNRAIVLGDGSTSIQLYYSPGFTALSALTPILFLFFGFFFAERKLKKGGKKTYWGKTVGSGIMAGLAIMGMHYVGNFGTDNYNLYNKPICIFGAAVISMSACTIALTLFFHQKEHWINHWWRRWMCACVLAAAVSGMHWVASVGTTYELMAYHSESDASLNNNLIVAIAISFGACLVCCGLFALIQRRRRQLADRAQHVVLAAATFDEAGRLLVTEEGSMPCQKITRRYNQQSFDDEFNVAHPVFQWIFRVTHGWSGVIELVPGMRNHLRTIGSLKEPSRPETRSSGSTNSVTGDEPYSQIFREHFCVAASDLATHLGVSLSDLGILFDDIIMTGTVTGEKKSRPTSIRSPQDVEAAVNVPAIYGNGQLLFVVREVDKDEALRLETIGYRWAALENVGEVLARILQISRPELTSTIDRLRSYTKRLGVPAKARSTQLACFTLQPTVKSAQGEWNVLVSKDNRSCLPMVPLSEQGLAPWEQQSLLKMDGYSVQKILDTLPTKAQEAANNHQRAFMEQFLTSVSRLTELVPEPFFRQAIFSAKAVEMCLGHDGAAMQMAMVLAFCVIPDVHSASIKHSTNLMYTPFSFFNCRQHLKIDEPGHGAMARRIHREFGPILASVSSPTKDSVVSYVSSAKDSMEELPPRTNRRPSNPFKSKKLFETQEVPSDGSSEQELVVVSSSETTPPVHSKPAFGGIMVSSDVTWTVHRDDKCLEMKDLGTKVEAGIADMEQPTYASQLFKTTCALWQRG